MKCSDYLHNFDIYLNIAHYYFDSSWFAIFPDYVVNGKLSQGNLRVNLSGVVQRQLSVNVDIHAEPNDQLPGTCVDAIAAAANGTATNVKNDLFITYPFNNSHDKQK